MFNNGMNTGYTLADIAAATGGNRNNSNGWDGNGSWWIIVLFLFAMFGGWNNENGGGLFGNRGGAGGGCNCATGSGITDGYILTSDFANIERKIDGVNSGICDGFYAQAQLASNINQNISTTGQNILTQMCNDGMSRMQDTFALQTAMNNNTNSVNAGITALGTQLAQCCCDNRYQSATQAADLNYRLAEQSCQTRQAITDAARDITLNQDNGTRSIIAAIQEMQTNALQDKIAALTADNQALKFAASQQAQNTYLVNALNPPAIPAYQVPNPYTGCCGYRQCGTTM